MNIINKKLLVASHNQGKIKEIQDLFQPFGIELISAATLGISEPEETGSTFEENALLKAKFCMNYNTQTPVLADDSGLVIPALNGAPGIYSARWAGPDRNFYNAMDKLEQMLINKPNCQAYFECVLILLMPDFSHKTFVGKWHGKITFPPRGIYGFGYDPIFIPNGFNITAAEMLPTQKNLLSHRAIAFKQLVHQVLHNLT
ncbi:MAG: RdgB/HAM1 family non-canonical purine NTP pyrophosphatase [Gammaproteobacteria bacterium]|jgi:XTP/dITP diphosphohydrolase